SAESAGLPARQRGARAHASDAQTAGDQAGARELRRPTTELRRVPARVQRGATARTSAPTDAGVPVPPLRARLPRATPSARLPGPLPREEDHDGRHLPLPYPAV